MVNDKPRKGSTITLYQRLGTTRHTLNYKVQSVKTLGADEAEQVEAYGRKWAEIIGCPAGVLGL